MIANIALPSFLPHSLFTLLGLVVIAAIEALFISKLVKISYKKSYGLALYANWKSTLVGIPVAWLLWLIGLIPVSLMLSYFGVEIHPLVHSVSIQSSIVGGFIPNEWTKLGMAIAWLIMLFPFCLGSIWIERKVLIRKLGIEQKPLITKGVIIGNLVTYMLFLGFSICHLFSALESLPEDRARYEKNRELQENAESPSISPET